MTHSDDAIVFSGFEGCAASREFYWHLASDREDHWDRFPKAQSWKWVPNNEKTCRMKDFSKEDMVKGLVEEGGWLVLGDSVSENHFFSLSCTLYPHVIATPYPWTSEHDRGYPQNLYLNPDSHSPKQSHSQKVSIYKRRRW
ncbi:hypothetical protein MPER_01091 [Moniliophthora perniciosa FA553]|nr:hypothetical protein MPER_01091 [Moniliophthora perniciosa FA553]